jgi:hypothetical protein
MYDGDDLDRFGLPNVADNVGIEVPEAVTAVQEFLVMMTDSGRLAQAMKRRINLGTEAFCSARAVIRYPD